MSSQKPPGLALAKLLRLDSNLALMASAGTGKTYSLISLCLHLLAGARRRGRVQPSKLCLVTFTDKAAKEMQHRLKQRLKALCAGEALEPELRHSLEAFELPFPSVDEWKKIYAHLPGVQIGTFHSLCLKIIQLTTGSLSHTELLNEVEAGALLEHCVSQVLLGALEKQNAAARHWVREAGFGSFSRRQGVVYCLWKTFVSLREEGLGAKRLRLDAPEIVKHKFQSEFQKLRACVEALLLLAEQKENQKKAIARMKGELLQTADTLHLISPDNAQTLCLLKEMSARFQSSRSAEIRPLKQALSELESIYWEQQLLPVEELAVELLQHIELHFEQELYSRNKADFTSLLLRARDGLRDFPERRLAIHRQWNALLVDEFQDCNRLQLELTLLLSERRDEVRRLSPQEEWRHAFPLEPGTLCVVGDAKQSIYEFRGADVGVFSMVATHLKNEGGEVGFLKNSFRTQENLICFFNAFFPKLFSPVSEKREFEVAYTNEADQLSPMRAAREGLPSVICLEDSSLSRVPLEAWRWADAKAIAKALSEIFQREPLKYADVAVLFRRLSYAPVYLEALQCAGIPGRIIQGTGFFGAQEIVDVVGLLTWLEDESDVVSKWATLRSPWVGLADETLLTLSMNNFPGDRDEGGIFKTQEEAKRYKKFQKVFSWLKKEKHRLGVLDILKIAMDETDFCQAVASFQNGEQALANLDKFLEMASKHDAKHRGDNAGFCQKIWNAMQLEQREMSSEVFQDDNLNCVTLCTVHQAKGLEWPWVVLADLNAVAPHEGGTLLFERSLGVAASAKALSEAVENESSKMKSLKKELQLRRQAEAKRLLYVAMTRARDALMLGLTSFPQKESWAAHISEILRPQTPEGLPAPAFCEALKTECVDVASLPSSSPDLLARAFAQQNEEAPPPQKEAETLPHWQASPLPLSHEEVVFSVTQLQEFERCPRWFFFRYYLQMEANLVHSPSALPPFSPQAHRPPRGQMSARERGEVTHRLLELMPFSWIGEAQASRRLEQLAQRLGLPWEEQIFHWLERFWSSEVGALFLKAGEERLERELPFSWAVPGKCASDWVLLLRGQVDLLLEYEEGHYLIVDYKTGAAENPQAYALQLACYGEAVRRWKNGTKIQTAIVFLREVSPKLHLLDEGRLSVYDETFLRERARGILDARASNVWPMRNLKECQSMGCQYIPFCYPS
ncbi:MAG: UvrD-helicase domain-containing protein [Cystobacterineae bacterium]|nr:UvrD-helicase domain-containing protein [Cystobacterineae bacterium]